ncbi:MAG: hypothetical protein J0L97_06300 [Alphaproteobacteria bacterium]|nr:hypothetical protein [Alphaproteobacteria bacterium]
MTIEVYLHLIKAIDDYVDDQLFSDPEALAEMQSLIKNPPQTWESESSAEIKNAIFAGSKAGSAYAKAFLFAKEHGHEQELSQIIDTAIYLAGKMRCTTSQEERVDLNLRWGCLAAALYWEGEHFMPEVIALLDTILLTNFLPHAHEDTPYLGYKWQFNKDLADPALHFALLRQGVIGQIIGDCADWLSDIDGEIRTGATSPNLVLHLLRSHTHTGFADLWVTFVKMERAEYENMIADGNCDEAYMHQRMAPYLDLVLPRGDGVIDIHAIYQQIAERSDDVITLGQIREISPQAYAAIALAQSASQDIIHPDLEFCVTEQSKQAARASREMQ